MHAGRAVKRPILLPIVLLLNAFSLNALSGRIVASPELFKGWQFTQSFVFVNQRQLYYPVGPDGSFTIPSDGDTILTLTSFVPGFQKATETFPSSAENVRLVVHVQTVSMEKTTYDAEVPQWLFDLNKNEVPQKPTQDDIASLIPFQVKPGTQSPGGPISPLEISLDVGKLINLILRLIDK